ncbi:MAG: tryptophan synthase subunit alpha [Nitrospinota bacterium]
MGRIGACLEALTDRGEKALFPYITAGDPDLPFTRRLIRELAARGAHGVEVGVPFSDPLADGPTIQGASVRALRAGATLGKVLSLVSEVRGEVEIPLILMTYYNPIFARGEERFVREAAAAGADGLIVPDLPPEEAGGLLRAAEDTPLDVIFMLAPTSTPPRMALVNEKGRGFIYYVAHMGVTGARGALASDLAEALRRINAIKRRPVLAGFGIKGPAQAAAVASLADGVIVGSALIDCMDAAEEEERKLRAAGDFVAALHQALTPEGAGKGAGRPWA